MHFLKAALEHDASNHELGLLLAEVYFQNQGVCERQGIVAPRARSQAGPFRSHLPDGTRPATERQSSAKPRTVSKSPVGLKEDSSAAHASLGSLFAEVGNRKKALKHLVTALKLKASAPVHFLLGAVYYDAGQHKRAIQHLTPGDEAGSAVWRSLLSAWTALPGDELARKAQECFKTAQALNPRESRYRKRVRSFSEEATGPDQLNGLIREELRLVKYPATIKRTK